MIFEKDSPYLSKFVRWQLLVITVTDFKHVWPSIILLKTLDEKLQVKKLLYKWLIVTFQSLLAIILNLQSFDSCKLNNILFTFSFIMFSQVSIPIFLFLFFTKSSQYFCYGVYQAQSGHIICETRCYYLSNTF